MNIKESCEVFLSESFYLIITPIFFQRLLTILLRDILSCQIFQNAMDALADPDNINQLIIIMLDPKSATLCDQETLPVTPILDNFTAFTGVKPEPVYHLFKWKCASWNNQHF